MVDKIYSKLLSYNERSKNAPHDKISSTFVQFYDPAVDINHMSQVKHKKVSANVESKMHQANLGLILRDVDHKNL
jgi:hypothetical protein